RQRLRAGRRRLLVVRLPGLADLLGPVLVALPAVDGMVSGGAVGRRFLADVGQPLAVSVPALLVSRTFRGRARRLRRCMPVTVTFVVERRAELMRFLLAHRLKNRSCFTSS